MKTADVAKKQMIKYQKLDVKREINKIIEELIKSRGKIVTSFKYQITMEYTLKKLGYMIKRININTYEVYIPD